MQDLSLQVNEEEVERTIKEGGSGEEIRRLTAPGSGIDFLRGTLFLRDKESALDLSNAGVSTKKGIKWRSDVENCHPSL